MGAGGRRSTLHLTVCWLVLKNVVGHPCPGQPPPHPPQTQPPDSPPAPRRAAPADARALQLACRGEPSPTPRRRPWPPATHRAGQVHVGWCPPLLKAFRCRPCCPPPWPYSAASATHPQPPPCPTGDHGLTAAPGPFASACAAVGGALAAVAAAALGTGRWLRRRSGRGPPSLAPLAALPQPGCDTVAALWAMSGVPLWRQGKWCQAKHMPCLDGTGRLPGMVGSTHRKWCPPPIVCPSFPGLEVFLRENTPRYLRVFFAKVDTSDAVVFDCGRGFADRQSSRWGNPPNVNPSKTP